MRVGCVWLDGAWIGWLDGAGACAGAGGNVSPLAVLLARVCLPSPSTDQLGIAISWG